VEVFCKASGLDINIKKSCFVYINIQDSIPQEVVSSWGVASSPLDDGFKYLGYFLKASSYRIVDWFWLVKKFEKRINFWANRWLSMGGRLVLVKFVLQNIQVYLSTLAKLPSFIKNRIKHIISSFLSRGAKNPTGFHFASCSTVAKPKYLGGWGIRDINLFNKALVAKSMWRVFFHQGLWSLIMRKKYLKGLDVVTWLKKHTLVFKIASLVWRNLMTTLPIIKRWLTWKVGSGQRILLGMDPFVGGGSFYKLSDNIVSSLHSNGKFTLAHINKEAFCSNWLTGQDLNLAGKEALEWSCFLSGLEQNAISLANKPDRLVWSWNKEDGMIKVKKVYDALVNHELYDEQKWWFSLIWKVKVPLKQIYFVRLCLKN